MNLSTTAKQTDDTSHATVHQADEEHATEITVIVAPPPENIRPFVKLTTTTHHRLTFKRPRNSQPQ